MPINKARSRLTQSATAIKGIIETINRGENNCRHRKGDQVRFRPKSLKGRVSQSAKSTRSGLGSRGVSGGQNSSRVDTQEPTDL